ncbi:hypothetical protein ACFQ7F_13120 [Streptomyces sp. NPDC056486]|uniref:hypothetical protein n=1 Tax=Streptomyces sp. NPDC056486 TaxID=3345835 RepID=UPI0036CEF1F3
MSALPAPELVSLADDEIEPVAGCESCYSRAQDLNVAKVNGDSAAIESHADRLRRHVEVFHR